MRWSLIVAAVASVAVPLVTRAETPLDEARQAYEAAEFRRAIELLERVERDAAFDRDTYVRLLELRALSHRALAEDEATGRTLRVLASVEPAYRFGPEAPPDLVEDFEAIRAALPGPIAFDARATPSPAGATVEARVVRDPENVLRALRVHARVDGGAWQSGNESLQVAAAPGARIEWYAEAVGPGGALLSTIGSAGAPRTLTLPAAAAPARDDGAGGAVPWTWIAVGGGALVIAGVVVAVVLASGGGDTDVQLRLDW